MSGSPLKRFSIWPSAGVSEATEATETDNRNASVAKGQSSASDREILPYRYLSQQSRQMWSKWQNLEKESIVRDSVMNRNVMLGQAFFKKTLGHTQPEIEIYFEEVIIKWVCDHIKVGDIDVAEDILTKAGFHPVDKMKDICLNTSDVIVRDYLMEHLSKKNVIDEDEQDSWKFLRLIESALSSIDYFKPKGELLSPGSSLQSLQHYNLPMSLVMNSYPSWQNVVWADIFLNTQVNNYESFVKPEIAWKLLLRRNDVTTITRWISNVLGKRNEPKQVLGKYDRQLSEDSIKKELRHEQAIKFDITQEMVDAVALEEGIPEMKDEILDCLCQHGMVSRSEVGWKLFRRFSRAGMLEPLANSWVGGSSSDIPSSLSATALDQLVEICVDKQLPEVLSLCLPHHGKTLEDVFDYFNGPPLSKTGLNLKTEKISWGVKVPECSPAYIEEKLSKYPPGQWPPIFSANKPECHLSVRDLLQEYIPGARTLFGGISSSGKDGELGELRHFSQGSASTRITEAKMDFIYYLRQARPTYAATAFLVDQINSHGNVQPERVSRACHVALKLAMSSPPDSMVGTACAIFSILIGGSPDKIRLYLAAARLVSSGIRGKKILFDPTETLNQTSEKNFEQLISVLESRKPPIPAKDNYVGELYTYSLNVSLSKFCGKGFPESLPRFFAENDMWLPFVLCLQIYRYPPDQAESLIRRFKSKRLRNHLWHALQLNKPEGSHRKSIYYSRIGIKQQKKTGTTRDSKESSSSESARTSSSSLRGSDLLEGKNSLYTLILRHHSRVEPVQPLPIVGNVPPNPFITVLETCVEGNSNLESLCKWLIGTCWNFGLYDRWEVRKKKRKKKNCTMEFNDIVIEEHEVRAACAARRKKVETPIEHPGKWTHEDTIILFQEVIRRGYFSWLAKGFYIFLPDNPLHPFAKSLAFAIEDMDFEKSLKNLHCFKSQLVDLQKKEAMMHRGSGEMPKDAIWDCKTVVQIAYLMILSALSMRVSAPQQRLNVLGVFRQANLCEISSEGVADLDVLYGLQECLCKTGPETLGEELDYSCLPPMVTTYPSKQWQENLKNCLNQLILKNHFDIGLQFAEIAELSKDNVLIEKWSKIFESHADDLSKPQSKLYRDLNTTLNPSKVEACNNSFVAHGISPDTAARFFTRMAKSMPPLEERYKILKMALIWFGKATKAQQNVRFSVENDISSEIEETEMSMWKCRLELEVNETPMRDTPEGPCMLPLRMTSDKIRRRAAIREQFSVASEAHSGLGSLIGLHLDAGDLTTAIRLESVFSHADRDVSLLLTCMALAEGDMYPEDAEPMIKALEEGATTVMPFQPSRLCRPGSLQSLSPVSLRSHFKRKTVVPEDFPEMDQEQTDASCKILAMLDRIISHLQKGRSLGIRIVACFRLAFYLNMPYLEVLNLQNPIETLGSHLRDVEDDDWVKYSLEKSSSQEDIAQKKLSLASDIIVAARLDRVGKAEFLRGEVLTAIHELEEPGNRSIGYSSGKVIMWGLSLDDYFPAVLDFCEDDLTCSLLGDLLISDANEIMSSQPPQYKKVVELLIRAHDCHSRACNMEGISRILHHARILTSSLLIVKEWSLMVRLLTGIKRYTEMNYILLALREHDHFEYVLGKGMDKVPGLRVALLDFLRRHCPGDKDLLRLVAIHFRLYAEVAELWLAEADAVIHGISQFTEQGDLPPKGPPEKMTEIKLPLIVCSDRVKSELRLAIQNYSHAAEYYLEANQPNAASRCAHKAELAALQISLVDVPGAESALCLLHLEPLQITEVVKKYLSFPQAWLLVRAYGVVGNWAAAVYTRYVVGGDSSYLSDFMRCQAVTPALVEDISRRYLLEGDQPSQDVSQRMANLLSAVPDIEVCYRLSSRLGLRGLTHSLLTSPHLPYLRDVVWGGGTTHNTR